MEKYIGNEGVSTMIGSTVGALGGPAGVVVGGLAGDVLYKKGVYGSVAKAINKGVRLMSRIPGASIPIGIGSSIKRKL